MPTGKASAEPGAVALTYLVSPPEKSSTWSIDVNHFVDQIRSRWPDAQVRRIESPETFHAMEAEVAMERGPLSVALSRDGQAVILGGDIEDCAEVALWVRQIVPEDQPLLFYDEGYGADVSLTTRTSKDEIVERFVAC